MVGSREGVTVVPRTTRMGLGLVSLAFLVGYPLGLVGQLPPGVERLTQVESGALPVGEPGSMVVDGRGHSHLSHQTTPDGVQTC